MLATVNHVPEWAPDDSNARTTLVAVPSLSGLSLRYTAPPASNHDTAQRNLQKVTRTRTVQPVATCRHYSPWADLGILDKRGKRGRCQGKGGKYCDHSVMSEYSLLLFEWGFMGATLIN